MTIYSSRKNNHFLKFETFTFTLFTGSLYSHTHDGQMMNSIPLYLTSISPWEFSVYIAPRDMIRAALPEAVDSFRSVLYLHGNTGTRLIPEQKDRRIKYQEVTGFDDLIQIITGAMNDLLLIEYCDEWFQDCPERISEFGAACKLYSKKRGAAVLLSVRIQYVIRSLLPFIGPVQWVQTPSKYAFSQKSLLVNEEQGILRYGQQTLNI